MTFPAPLHFLNRYTQFLELTPNWWGLLRITLWCLLFLIAFHFVAPSVKQRLPFADEMEAGKLIPLAASTSDPRYMRRNLNELPTDSILWVAESSIIIAEQEEVPSHYLPSEVQKFLPKNTIRKQNLSLKVARRLIDTYTMVADALYREPGALVIILNPFWIVNDNALFYKENVINYGAYSWLNAMDKSLIALLASPGNLLWGYAGQKHNLIANAYDYHAILQEKYLQASSARHKESLDEKKQEQKPEQKPAPEKAKLSYTHPLILWITGRNDDNSDDFINSNAKLWQAESMKQNSVDRSSWGRKLLMQMLQKIESSDIPTLIYVAPLSPELKNSATAYAAYRTVVKQVRELAQPFESERMKIIYDIPQRVISSMTYVDYIHLRDSGGFPEYLGKEITSLLEAR